MKKEKFDIGDYLYIAGKPAMYKASWADFCKFYGRAKRSPIDFSGFEDITFTEILVASPEKLLRFFPSSKDGKRFSNKNMAFNAMKIEMLNEGNVIGFYNKKTNTFYSLKSKIDFQKIYFNCLDHENESKQKIYEDDFNFV